jgi:hypothetical protein
MLMDDKQPGNNRHPRLSQWATRRDSAAERRPSHGSCGW